MTIVRRYRNTLSRWTETTEKECLEHTEKRGYWKPRTVLKMLQSGQTVSTPFAEYKAKKNSA